MHMQRYPAAEEGIISDYVVSTNDACKRTLARRGHSTLRLDEDVFQIRQGVCSTYWYSGRGMEANFLNMEVEFAGPNLHSSSPTTSATMATHLLFESASGYAVFEVKLHEEVGSRTKAVQDSINDLAKFNKMVSLLSFSPFKSAADALENINDISEGTILFFYSEWYSDRNIYLQAF